MYAVLALYLIANKAFENVAELIYFGLMVTINIAFTNKLRAY
jgi:hypothetical protein